MLLHFHSNGHSKYAWEALRLQFQLATLPPAVAHKLKWGRFVNTHGGQGRNISCDLHNEHLIKLFKDTVCNMGANLTEAVVTRAARAVTTLYDIAYVFDKVTEIPDTQNAHSTIDDDKDVKQVVSTLNKVKVFEVRKGRKHSQFAKISCNSLSKLNMQRIISWIGKKQQEMYNTIILLERVTCQTVMLVTLKAQTIHLLMNKQKQKLSHFSNVHSYLLFLL